MAIRNIRMVGDEILKKKCKYIKEVTPRIKELAADMLDTMYNADGIGLAAPQVGVLKRLVVIDINGTLDEEENEVTDFVPLIMLNPEIIESEGSSLEDEGCLSVPGMAGKVYRPTYVKAKYYDLDMNENIIEGRGLLARAICHEFDHLNGEVYVDKVVGELREVE